MVKKKKKRSLRRSPRKGPALERFVSSGQYLFWLAHGTNYLASDLESTLWRQVFDVYSNGLLPSKETIQREVRCRFEEGTPVRWWCEQKPRFVFGVFEEAQRKIKEEASLKGPHNEAVWEVFEGVRERVR